MEQITIRLPDELIDSLDDEAEQKGVSRSEYIRDVLTSRHEADALRDEIADLRTEVDRLQNEKRTLIERHEEHTELVKYVESEQQFRSAPLWTRAKWWVLGMEKE